MSYKFQLEEYNGKSTRYDCPSCGAKKRFTRYVDAEGNYIDSSVGKCDREQNCSYHYPPHDYFSDYPDESNFKTAKPITKPPRKRPTFIPPDDVQKTLDHCKESIFFQQLEKHFGIDTAMNLANDYMLGTAKGGKVIFWQIDLNINVRTGKIMLYTDELKRDKTVPPSWAHSKYSNFTLVQVPYGLHQLKLTENKGKPVCIVESEKTAILANIIMPEKVWLSVGSVQNLAQVQCVKQKIFLFPDKGCCEIWEEKADKLYLDYNIVDFMENTALPEGSDIADYILKGGAKST